MNTQKVLFLTVPPANPLAVHSRLPVAKVGAMALSAEAVGLGKTDQLTAGQPQFVAVRGAMTVQAPPVPGVVLKNDTRVLVFEFAPLGIILALGVTIGAGIVTGKRWRWSLNQLL